MPSGFKRFGNLSFVNQFSIKWHQLASTASDVRKWYQWKIGLLMIHSRDWNWSSGSQGWSNHQDQKLFLMKWGCQCHWGHWVVDAVEVIQSAQVLRPRNHYLPAFKFVLSVSMLKISATYLWKYKEQQITKETFDLDIWSKILQDCKYLPISIS